MQQQQMHPQGESLSRRLLEAQAWRCDGANDCLDDSGGGSDEKGCELIRFAGLCSDDEFQCESSEAPMGGFQCIPKVLFHFLSFSLIAEILL